MQAHAKHLEVRSQQANSQPEHVRAQAQAQSFQAKAHSFEKAAEAQNLQVLILPPECTPCNTYEHHKFAYKQKVLCNIVNRICFAAYRLRQLPTSKLTWRHNRMLNILQRRRRGTLRPAWRQPRKFST